MSGLDSKRISLLEIACGSGNDYRAIRDFGLAAHISYSGFDISWKNISNARAQYPNADFFEASILDSGLPDHSFDLIFVHDLICHLSPEGIEVAMNEIMRIARREAWIHCYNVADIDHHEIHPHDLCFQNRLSMSQLTSSLRQTGASVNEISIPALLKRKFNFTQEYTASSCTFVATRKPSQEEKQQEPNPASETTLQPIGLKPTFPQPIGREQPHA